MVTAVLSANGIDTPLAASHRIVVREVPTNQPFLVGPILTGDASFEGDALPVIRQQAHQGEPLTSVTRACFVGKTGDSTDLLVQRTLSDANGTEQLLEPATTRIDAGSGARCQEIVDDLAEYRLNPGPYTLRASTTADDGTLQEGEGPFTVLPAPSP